MIFALLLFLWIGRASTEPIAPVYECWTVSHVTSEGLRLGRQFYCEEGMALPPAKKKVTEGYHEYMDRMTKEQQEAVNSLTAKLDELSASWSGFYVTDKHPGPKGYTFTGSVWRGLLIYARRSA